MGLWVAGAGTSGRSRVLAIQKNLKIAVLSGINCNICLEIYIVPIDLFVGISSSSSLTHKSYSIYSSKGQCYRTKGNIGSGPEEPLLSLPIGSRAPP